MTRECFSKLCGQEIETNIGRENIKSEQYLKEVRTGILTEKKGILKKLIKSQPVVSFLVK